MAWKILRYSLFSILGFFLLAIFAVLFAKVNPQQQLGPPETVAPRLLDSAYYAPRIDSLIAVWGSKKELPEGYELQTLLALSYFPELKEANIKISYLPATLPMASRPYFWTMFRPREQWTFQVLLSSESTEKFEPILLNKLPFNAQTGIIAHELSHTAYYQNLGFWQLLKFGILYVIDQDFRRIHERSTDEQAIHHGFGWQLYDYAHFIRNNIPAVSSYNSSGHDNYMDRFYLSDEEVLERMEAFQHECFYE